MHYAVPRALHEAGLLSRFFTDICAAKGWPRLLRAVPPPFRTAGMKRLLERVPHGVPAEKISAFTTFGWAYARRRRLARSTAEAASVDLWAGNTFCDLVVRQGLGDASGVYALAGAALELLRHCRRLGRTAILEQPSAPREVEAALVAREWEKFPDWEERLGSNGFFRVVGEQERSEWDSADIVLCPSDFVRHGIGSCGGPVDRCVVVPYGLDLAGRGFSSSARLERRRVGPLRILTVGSVCLQKGPQYTLAAARMLGTSVEFRIVGPLLVSEPAQKELSKNVQLIGAVPRSKVVRHYAWADVFLLPSVCEGFGIVLLEALAEGLPVITTTNAGTVVRDGGDGFVVPIRDPEAIADRIQRFATDPSLLASMSASARERAEEFSLQRYTCSLSGVIDSSDPLSRSVTVKA